MTREGCATPRPGRPGTRDTPRPVTRDAPRPVTRDAPRPGTRDTPRPGTQEAPRPGSRPLCTGPRPSTSPACADHNLNPPRDVAIRSRVLLRRTLQGPQRVPLPRELVPVGVRIEHDNAGEACTARARCMRTTLFVGDGAQHVPVELVSSQPIVKRAVASRVGAWAEKPTNSPALTPELRADLKQRLDSLVSMCRTDFKAHPRSCRFFLRELWELGQVMKVPVSNRQYRRQLAGDLYQFVLHIPWPAELAPSAAELSEDVFLPLTVMLALDAIRWEFKFNRVSYHLCNCGTAFGSQRCLLPTSHRPSEFAREGDERARKDLIQRQERHLPTRLLDVSAALRVRFLEFVEQVPVFQEDLLKCTEKQMAYQRLLWEKWANLVMSEIAAFDNIYTQFERLYMTIVQQLIENTLEPLRSMARTCDSLMRRSSDPFREVEAAALCQRLGLLKQTVDFEGLGQVAVFDPALLHKAQRVLQMETYTEVREMARVLLKNFESLCKVLVHLNDDQVKLELKENGELTAAILRLEQVWADCQFILHQGCLDFIELLEREVLPPLSPRLKWQIRVALEGSGKQTQNPAELQDLQEARVALYQTVPMMVYVDELCSDGDGNRRKVRFTELCCPQDERHHTLRRDFGKFDEKRFNEFRSFLIAENEKNKSQGRQTDFFRLVYRQLKAVSAFPIQANLSEAILAASKAQAALKQPGLSDRDIAEGQRQLELLEGGARWLCLMLKVQAVAPQLFPSKKPGSEKVSKKESHSHLDRAASRGRRVSVSVALSHGLSGGRRGSISHYASEAH